MHPNLPSLEISGWVERRMSTSGIAWRRPVRAGSLTVGNSLGRSLQRGEEVKILFAFRVCAYRLRHELTRGLNSIHQSLHFLCPRKNSLTRLSSVW